MCVCVCVCHCECIHVWQSQVESEHYSYQILTAVSDSALYNSRLREAMALQVVVEIVLYRVYHSRMYGENLD